MTVTVRQGEIDLATLVARIRLAFPDLRFAKAALNDLGEDHAVVVLDDQWVVRFPRTEVVAARDLAERRLLTALSPRSPIATPCYSHVSEHGDIAGYRMIAGEPLTPARFAGLPPVAQGRILEDIGAFLAVLHALPPDFAADPEPADSTWFVDRYRERRDVFAEVLGAALLDAADRFYQALPAAVATKARVVTHRDVTDDHILVDPSRGRLAGVIDFTDAALGDPAFDFAYLWAYGPSAPGLAAHRYSGAAGIARLLTRSRWWYARYRLDQIWWSASGARGSEVSAIRRDVKALFIALGV